MMIGKSYSGVRSSYLKDNDIAKQQLRTGTDLGRGNCVAKETAEECNSWENSASYSVMISTEARLMVMAERKNDGNSSQENSVTSLIVGSEEEKEWLLSALRKGSDGKVVNEALQKFCEENGIDTNLSPETLESYIVVVDAEEMKRKSDRDTLHWNIQFDLNGLLDPFQGGKQEGPPGYVYRMFEKRLSKYAKDLTEYVDKFGASEELQRRIDKFLTDNNKNGSNQVAQLVKDITNKVFSGKTDEIDKIIGAKAEEAFNATFKNEIQDSRQAENKKREKLMDQMKKENEQITKQREVLEDKIKELREKLLELEKNQSGIPGNADQIKLLEKQLEELEKRLKGLKTDFSLPPEIDYKEADVSVYDWMSDSLDNSAFTEKGI